MPNSVVITAGYPQSKNAVKIANALKESGVDVKGFIVVTPWSFKRFQSLTRTHGSGFIRKALKKLYGGKKISPSSVVSRSMKLPSIPKWAKKHGVSYTVVKNLNDSRSLAFLDACRPDLVIYTGGGILRSKFLRSAGKTINAHAGPLPEVRGMNACEWSVLLGYRTVVTIHEIDEGIDTGRVIKEFPYSVEPGDSIESLRQKVGQESVKGLVSVVLSDLSDNSFMSTSDKHASNQFRQCFVMAPAIKEILEKRLGDLG